MDSIAGQYQVARNLEDGVSDEEDQESNRVSRTNAEFKIRAHASNVGSPDVDSI